MGIDAKVIADSISENGIRLTTLQLRYPRFIHSEFMTHRVFSRNASSSRAIPIQRMIEDVKNDPAMPVYWGKNKPGMQAGDELLFSDKDCAITRWLLAKNSAVHHAESMALLGVHKQIVNRILEPWQHISVVVSSTDWANFFALRRHEDAQPEIRVLADEMFVALNRHIPQILEPAQWHLPYLSTEELYLANVDGENSWVDWRKVSAARCARVSYLKHDGQLPNVDEDLKLFDRLAGGFPLHASPLEHQATPDKLLDAGYEHLEHHGNFRGWIQHRKLISGEYVHG